MNKTNTEINEIPAPLVSGARLVKIETIAIPHPYCIGAKHVGHASRNFNGMLGIEAIEDAERHGITCDICKEMHRKNGTKILKYAEHEQRKTLFIEVPQNNDLNKINGLVEYLNSIKPICEKLKIDGFAFPQTKNS